MPILDRIFMMPFSKLFFKFFCASTTLMLGTYDKKRGARTRVCVCVCVCLCVCVCISGMDAHAHVCMCV